MYLVTITVKRREEAIPEVQEILTKYGNQIYSRIGFNKVPKDNRNFIIVMYTGTDIKEFVQELKENKHIGVNYMEI